MELREMLLSFQTGFNLVNAAFVSAILESISGLELSSDKLKTLYTVYKVFDTAEPRYLKSSK